VVEIENKITEFLLYLEKNSEKNFSRWLTGVNIFEILGITSAEIRHSRILAWLLDPRESQISRKQRYIEKVKIILMFCIQIRNIESI